MIFRR